MMQKKQPLKFGRILSKATPPRTLQSIYVYYCSVELLLYSISFQLVSGFERLKLSRLYPYPNTF